MHYTIYTIHYTLYTIQYRLYTIHYTTIQLYNYTTIRLYNYTTIRLYDSMTIWLYNPVHPVCLAKCLGPVSQLVSEYPVSRDTSVYTVASKKK